MTNLEKANTELQFFRFSKLWYEWMLDVNPPLIIDLLSKGNDYLQEKLNNVQEQASEYYQNVYEQLEKHRASEKSSDYLKNLHIANEIQSQALEFTLQFIYEI